MSEHQYCAVYLRELEQRLTDQLAFLQLGRLRIGGGLLSRALFQPVLTFLSGAVLKDFAPALPPPEFVVAKIQGDAPQVSREAARRFIIFSFLEEPRERFLFQVLAAVRVAGHPRA